MICCFAKKSVSWHCRRRFTLVETVVAIGILALTLGGLYSLLYSSQKRMTLAMEKWNETHMLIEASEYYLLHGADTVSTIPQEFFPYGSYTVNCTHEDVDDLPEDYTGIDTQKELKTCRVTLTRTSDGRELGEILVDRIIYDDSLSPEN